MLLKIEFADGFKELCDLYGRKFSADQCDAYWRIISEKKWNKFRFLQILTCIKESETTFPSLAKIIMVNRDLPGENPMPKEEAESLWDSIPECGDCADGVVYLVPIFAKGSKLMGACAACQKGELRKRRNPAWTLIHPILLRTTCGTSFSHSHKLDPLSHAKWPDISIKEVKTLRALLPKSGSLDQEYLRCLKKYRPDLFESLLKEDSK